MNEQIEFVKLIAARLDSAGIKYMLTGSNALAVYSTPRMTRDIDLVVEIDISDINTIIRLFSEDCYVETNTVKQAILDQGMFNIVHKEWVLKADFIVRKNEVYREAEFARKRIVTIDGATISIVAPEDLVLSKLVWAKQSESTLQLKDVKQLLQELTDVDWNYLTTWAATLGIADLLRKARPNE